MIDRAAKMAKKSFIRPGGPITITIALFALLLIPFDAIAAEGKIAVLFGKGIKAHNAVLEGLRSTRGLDLAEFQITEDEKGMRADDIKASKPQVVIAIGAKAAFLAKKYLNEFPLLFCLVLYPEKLGLIGKDSFGISVEVSVEDQINLIKKISSKVKRVGIIYNPESGSPDIKAAQRIAQEKEVDLVGAQARAIGEISSALDSFRDNIDAFWMTSDPVVANAEAFQAILLFTLKEKIPLIVPALPLVDKGALAAIGPDFVKIGKQAGEMAKKVIGGRSPKSIGLVAPEGVEIAVNKKTADLIGIKLPESIIRQSIRVVR